jgi:nucleotide-binding universal stress UspA family protein
LALSLHFIRNEVVIMKNSIVAAVDFSSVTPLVLEKAAKETKLRPGAQLHLVHVIPPPIAAPVGAIAPSVGLDMTGAIDAAREELQRAARGANLAGVSVLGHVRIGGTVDEIIALADEVDADLIVVGGSTKGLAMRALLGSTARPLTERAPCSVLVARASQVPEIEPRRADQEDDVHKRHHKPAHHYQDPPERLGTENESFRFTIEP